MKLGVFDELGDFMSEKGDCASGMPVVGCAFPDEVLRVAEAGGADNP